MNRKKLAALIMMLSLAITTMVGGTLAYFTDTDDATNVFTAGNVEIDLTETEVEYDAKGNLVSTGNRMDVGKSENEYNYGKLYPGMTVDKDPTIKNLGSEDVFVAAKIVVTSAGDLERVLGTGYEGLINIKGLVKGGFVDDDADIVDTYGNLPIYGDGEKYKLFQTAEDTDDDGKTDTYEFHLLFLKTLKYGEEVVLFEELEVPASWDNAQMVEMVDLVIDVQAYAVQAYGFEDDALAAINAAFNPPVQE